MRRVWIAQMLCGPNRHCVAALTTEADGENEARQKLVGPLQATVDQLLAGGSLNPWCGICEVDRASWRVELGVTRFKTAAEAEGPMQRETARQMLANALLGTHGPKPPGKPN